MERVVVVVVGSMFPKVMGVGADLQSARVVNKVYGLLDGWTKGRGRGLSISLG